MEVPLLEKPHHEPHRLLVYVLWGFRHGESCHAREQGPNLNERLRLGAILTQVGGSGGYLAWLMATGGWGHAGFTSSTICPAWGSLEVQGKSMAHP